MKRYPTTLIIAGSDSSGGAGIQADIKTCSAIGVYASTAITAITAQNTMGVIDIQPITPDIVTKQIKAVLDDLIIDSIKIGMLCNASIVKAVADALNGIDIPIITDPVMVSTSGHKLLSDDAIDAVVKYIFPLSEIVTPNLHEASLLSGMDIVQPDDIIEAAHKTLSKGCRAVLMKGGHFDNLLSTDTLIDNNLQVNHYSSPRYTTHNTHGTGCTLSSAIAAYRAKGYNLQEATARAKEFVTQAIAHGSDVFAGRGHGALNHAFAPQPLSIINM